MRVRSTYFSERLFLDMSFAPLMGWNYSVDFHVGRNLYFIQSGFGNGFLARFESKFFLNQEFSVALRYTAHRYYAIGEWRISGIPNNIADLTTTSTSRRKDPNWVTNKESRWEVYFEYKVK